jgi:hypothetical protein
MEHLAADDELVYRVEDCLPLLCFTRALAGRKSLCFEGSLSGAYVEALADSGATHSFVASEYLHRNGISYKPVSVSAAHLANGDQVNILGITDALELKLGAFLYLTHIFGC